ncbi:hypothetical protein [Nocardia noduli]|uniref:hypothetical protein n=1 Tax=Nocardia noduli TaxID=2815722 RepID=UPI001C24A5EF|nr:hypothetical protein [Nocardia noduli]
MVEPALIAIASALAARAAASLYELVRAKFGDDSEETAALEAADGAEPGSPPVQRLAGILERTERTDPEFGTRLRGEWSKVGGGNGDINNQISGTVSGNALQARDIGGGVTF